MALSKIFRHDVFSTVSIMGMRVSMLAAKFILSLFIARYMGLETLGIYGLILSLSGTVQVCTRLGLFNTLSRDAVHEPKSRITVNLHHYFTGLSLIYLLIAPVAVGTGLYFDQLPIAILAVFILLCEHLAYDIFTLTSDLQKPRLANIMLTVQSASWVYLYIVLAFFIPALRTLESLMAFWICGSAIMIGVAVIACRQWPWKEAFAQKLDIDWYKSNIRRSWHLYSGDVLGVFNLYIDRYLITIFLSIEILGVYVLFSQITNAICNLVNSGVLQIYKPRLIMADKEGNTAQFHEYFRLCVLRTFAGAAGISIVCAIIIPYLIPFTKEALAMHYMPLFWMLLGANMFRIGNDLAKAYLYASHQDATMLKSNVLGLVLCLTAGSASLYFMGIYGVVLTNVIVYGAVIAYIACYRRLPGMRA